VLEKSPHPLAQQVAGIAANMRAQAADQAAQAGLIASLHALILAALAQIFAHLGAMFDLWQSGQLPPCPAPAPRSPSATTQRTTAHATPSPEPCRRPHARNSAAPAPAARRQANAGVPRTNSRPSSAPRHHAAQIRPPHRAAGTVPRHFGFSNDARAAPLTTPYLLRYRNYP